MLVCFFFLGGGGQKVGEREVCLVLFVCFNKAKVQLYIIYV